MTRRLGIPSGLFYAGVSFGTEIAVCLALSLVDLYARYDSLPPLALLVWVGFPG